MRALGVDAAGECERAVGLDGVEGGDHGDLGGVSAGNGRVGGEGLRE